VSRCLMPYSGLPLVCERCGQTFTRPPSLKRHSVDGRCPGRAIVPAKPRLPRPEPIRAKVLDVTPARSQIVSVPSLLFPPKRSPRITLAPDLRDAERPPSFWEPQADEEWRIRQWNRFPADYRSRLLAERAGTAFTIRAPQAKDEVILRSQYHALKALATRLDAGIGTERERAAFEAGLREYDANYDRIRAQRKS
jgi:hypothetical protein